MLMRLPKYLAPVQRPQNYMSTIVDWNHPLQSRKFVKLAAVGL